MDIFYMINIPLGYARLSQLYTFLFTDFMLAEIVLFALILIMTKGIFEVKISKIQFAILQTKEAAQYFEEAVSDYVKNGDQNFLAKTISVASKKSIAWLPDSATVSDIDYKNMQCNLMSGNNNKSAISSNSFFSVHPLESSPKSHHSNILKLDSINVQSSENSTSQFVNASSEVGDSPGLLNCSTEAVYASSEAVNSSMGENSEASNLSNLTHTVDSPRVSNPSTASYVTTEDMTPSVMTCKFSSGSKSSNFSQQGGSSKPSKSVPQVLNQFLNVESRSQKSVQLNKGNSSKISKSLSQGLHPSNTVLRDKSPGKHLRYSQRSNSEKNPKSKATDPKISLSKS